MSGIRRWVKVGSFQGVAASSTATTHLATNQTFHSLILSHANAVSTLDEIRVMANGVAIHRYSGAQLDALNQYYGRAAGTSGGELFIDFDRRGIRARGGAEISGIGTAPFNPETNLNPITSLSVEVDLDATASPSLSMVAQVSGADPAGSVRKVRPFTHSPAGSGDFQIGDLPRGDIILAAHMSSSAITALRVETNQVVRHDLTKDQNDVWVTDGFEGRVAQTNYYHYDPAADGHGSEWLVTDPGQDLRLIATVSGATTISSLIEYLGPVAN